MADLMCRACYPICRMPPVSGSRIPTRTEQRKGWRRLPYRETRDDYDLQFLLGRVRKRGAMDGGDLIHLRMLLRLYPYRGSVT